MLHLIKVPIDINAQNKNRQNRLARKKSNFVCVSLCKPITLICDGMPTGYGSGNVNSLKVVDDIQIDWRRSRRSGESAVVGEFGCPF